MRGGNRSSALICLGSRRSTPAQVHAKGKIVNTTIRQNIFGGFCTCMCIWFVQQVTKKFYRKYIKYDGGKYFYHSMFRPFRAYVDYWV